MLPAAFKKQLPKEAQERFVVKPDVFEKCLVLYPINEWERLEKSSGTHQSFQSGACKIPEDVLSWFG